MRPGCRPEWRHRWSKWARPCRPGRNSRRRSPSTHRRSPKPSGASDYASICRPAGCESTAQPYSTASTNRPSRRLILQRATSRPSSVEPVGTAEIVAAAAVRAPSGGNAQPWHIEARDAFGEHSACSRAHDNDGCRIPRKCSSAWSGNFQRQGRRGGARDTRACALSARGRGISAQGDRAPIGWVMTQN